MPEGLAQTTCTLNSRYIIHAFTDSFGYEPLRRMWHSQEHELVPHEELSLVVLAPTVSGALRDELRALGFEASQHEPGIFRVTGLPFAAWLVETDVMAERGQPVLALVSRVFLNDRGRIIEKLERSGHRALLRYMVQQIKQFESQGEWRESGSKT